MKVINGMKKIEWNRQKKNGMNHEYDKLGWNGINKMEWDE